MAGNGTLGVAFLVGLGRNKPGLILVGSVVGFLVSVILLMWLYLSLGLPGILGAAALVFAGVALAFLSGDQRAQRRRRAAAAQAAHRAAWLTQWPAEARPTIDQLVEQESAAVLWSAVGLGRMADPHRYGPDDKGDAPALLDIRRSAAGVEIDLEPYHGMTANDFKRVGAPQLAWALGVPEVLITAVDPQRRVVTLDLRYFDPVATAVPMPHPTGPVNLYAVALGVRASGKTWTEAIAERNLLVAGVMGSGKSGIMRALVASVAPATHEGTVRTVAIDLKFGIEVRQMRGLLHEVATTPKAAHQKLKRMLAMVKARGEWMEANGYDKHVATREEPLWLLIIDELAELLDDPEARKDVLSLLRHIMRPGRALGFSIAAFTQAPEKENIASVRNLFQIRIGLRLTEEDMLRMIYGADAKERGAGNVELADQGTQGIAFVAAEGGRDIERVRGYHVTSEMLEAVAKIYPPYRHPQYEPAPALPPGQSDSNRSATPSTGQESGEPTGPSKKPVPSGANFGSLDIPQVGAPPRKVIPFDRTARADRPEAAAPTATDAAEGDTGTE